MHLFSNYFRTVFFRSHAYLPVRHVSCISGWVGLVLLQSTQHSHFVCISFDITLCGWLGSKHLLTNSLCGRWVLQRSPLSLLLLFVLCLQAFPILIGDIDPSGNLNANIIHAFSERLRTKCVAQVCFFSFFFIFFLLSFSFTFLWML